MSLRASATSELLFEQVSFGKRHNVAAALEIARNARTILAATASPASTR